MGNTQHLQDLSFFMKNAMIMIWVLAPLCFSTISKRESWGSVVIFCSCFACLCRRRGAYSCQMDLKGCDFLFSLSQLPPPIYSSICSIELYRELLTKAVVMGTHYSPERSGTRVSAVWELRKNIQCENGFTISLCLCPAFRVVHSVHSMHCLN